ncbi:hypothetical protein OIU76_024694 [Salix suchowensis]|uniref:Uncharacterized protein n=1 Tax=Salix suchowensis TaxID=1278906 RepID=A0ABQ9AYV7_9ROSI|nr:hypothetical protein OIU76_024694 [Salix suchowensis]KAJ6366761.1 hypothetical protein OIU77_003192 [Salix suchowensis]
MPKEYNYSTVSGLYTQVYKCFAHQHVGFIADQGVDEFITAQRANGLSPVLGGMHGRVVYLDVDLAGWKGGSTRRAGCESRARVHESRSILNEGIQDLDPFLRMMIFAHYNSLASGSVNITKWSSIRFL